MTLEIVEARSPHEAVGGEPFVEIAQRFRTNPVNAALGVTSYFHQSRLAEYSKVLGDPGLTHSQCRNELPDRLLAFAEEVEDLPATGLGQDL